MLRGEPSFKGGPGLIKDLDIENWKGKENTCIMKKSHNSKDFHWTISHSMALGASYLDNLPYQVYGVCKRLHLPNIS